MIGESVLVLDEGAVIPEGISHEETRTSNAWCIRVGNVIVEAVFPKEGDGCSPSLEVRYKLSDERMAIGVNPSIDLLNLFVKGR